MLNVLQNCSKIQIPYIIMKIKYNNNTDIILCVFLPYPNTKTLLIHGDKLIQIINDWTEPMTHDLKSSGFRIKAAGVSP